MYDVGIITLIAIATLVMLIRGDPKWTLPALIGAFVLFLVPAVTVDHSLLHPQGGRSASV